MGRAQILDGSSAGHHIILCRYFLSWQVIKRKFNSRLEQKCTSQVKPRAETEREKERESQI